MEEVKQEVLRLVGERVIEFQKQQFARWFGKPWRRDKDVRGIIVCPRCAENLRVRTQREEAKMLLQSVR